MLKYKYLCRYKIWYTGVQRYIPKDVHGSVFYNNKNNEKKSKSLSLRD